VSQSSEFCRHNPLCCFSTSVFVVVVVYFVIDSVRKLLDVPSYVTFADEPTSMPLINQLFPYIDISDSESGIYQIFTQDVLIET